MKANSSFIILVISLLMFQVRSYAQQDRFAKIGAQEYSTQKNGLIEPGPPVLHDRILPGGINDQQKYFIKNPINSKDELYRELDSLKKYYLPYMQQLSRLPEKTRNRISIPAMNWREETEEDQKDAQHYLTGKGKWKKVNIPHYGPPLGHAVTYYSNSIELADSMFEKERIFFCFKGVDYKAEVYFNGNYCGSHEGFFAPFEFDITAFAKKGTNTYVIKVINEPTTTGSSDGSGHHVVGDKIYAAGGPGYDEPMEGWHICPPGIGIYQDCYIEARNEIFIKDIFVRPLPNSSSAEVWLELFHDGKVPRNISLDLSLYGKNFPITVFEKLHIDPSTTIVPGVGDMVKPTDWKQKGLVMEYGTNYLKIPVDMKGFRWWSPDQPWLYSMIVTLLDEQKKTIDEKSKHFGMRSFTMDTINKPKGMMYLNGNPIRLRGANSMGFEQNDVMRKNFGQLIDDILLARLCNMNYFRFTQRPVQEEVYDYCDMLGMLNQTDLPFFGAIRISQFTQAVKQAEEMERLVRSHPSAIMVTYINERFPNAEGSPHRSFGSATEVYTVFKALDQAVLLSNPDRVIKAGDGDYDPPSPGLPDNHCYNTWYNGHAMDLGKFLKGYWQLVKPDWYYGCGEFGAEGLDLINVMQKYYPKDWLPKDLQDSLVWSPKRISKSQSEVMHHMWYKTPKGLGEWVNESQNFQAWAVRLVTESFRRDIRNVSCAVHLFIDAWPAGWMKAIMDVDRQPKPAFFAYRNALAPLMASLRTDRFYWYAGENAEVDVWVANDLNYIPANLTLGYEVNIGGKLIVKNMMKADVLANAPAYQGRIRFLIPELKRRSKGSVRIGLFNEKGECIHSNEQELVFFPSERSIQEKVYIAGLAPGDNANELITFGITPVTGLKDAKVAVIQNIDEYKKNRKEFDDFVFNGGRLLFNEVGEGKHDIGNTEVHIQHTIMGEYYFADVVDDVLKKTDLDNKDIFMWYDKEKGYVQPLLGSVFRANGWKPLVETGLCNFAGEDPSGYLAAAQLPFGKGKFIINQLRLMKNASVNPPAHHLFKYMLKN